ncbi:MAG: hypothetical protein H7Z74_18945 [Anaerolineae bacterium]|nr:hypothetical protein [Gemmatimonadaceae bacterium]
MLEFLDLLCAALIARDDEDVRLLLKHPIGRELPREVREEALAIAALPAESHRAPMKTLWFRYAMEQLQRDEFAFLHSPQLDLPFMPPLPSSLVLLPTEEFAEGALADQQGSR